MYITYDIYLIDCESNKIGPKLPCTMLSYH